MRRATRSPRMTPTGRPMPPARGPLVILPLHRAKRKRTLYRRFLVSLGVRRRTPTRLSLNQIRLRRRRETRHDSGKSGVSSQYSLLDSFDSRCRTDSRRYPLDGYGARRGASAFAAGPRNRGAPGNDGRADGRPVYGPEAVPRGRGDVQKALGSRSPESRVSEQARHRSAPAGSVGAGAEIL